MTTTDSDVIRAIEARDALRARATRACGYAVPDDVFADTLRYGDVRIDVTGKGTARKVMSRHLAVRLSQAGVWRLAAWQSTPVPG